MSGPVIELHPAQSIIFHSDARFKVVAAGRRFGKSHLAAVTLLVAAMEDVNWAGFNLNEGHEVYYIAPTFEQGKKIMWPKLKELGLHLVQSVHENTGVMTLKNGRRISVKGADRPDSLRGIGLSHVVLDEYATMKEEVWDEIIRPALMDVKGTALFIGTPKGKNHFYQTYLKGFDNEEPEYESFEFTSEDNPFLPTEELKYMKDNYSTELYRQELLAKFQSGGGKILNPNWFKISKTEPEDGFYIVTVDPAGFSQEGIGKRGKLKLLDYTAIVSCKVHRDGWYIKNIDYGRWDVRETALRIIKAAVDCGSPEVGIERGMAKNAIMPYLEDEMLRIGRSFQITDLSHGGKSKPDRIRWALQGRAENGRIVLNKGNWNEEFLDQAADFPSRLSHDDLIDALAYVDQIATPIYGSSEVMQYWQPLDEVAQF